MRIIFAAAVAAATLPVEALAANSGKPNIVWFVKRAVFNLVGGIAEAVAGAKMLLSVVSTFSVDRFIDPNKLPVRFLTDDQDQMLGGSFPQIDDQGPMAKTKQLMQEGGSMAERFYIHTPICNPSRSELYVYFSSYSYPLHIPILPAVFMQDSCNGFQAVWSLFPQHQGRKHSRMGHACE